MRSEIEGALRAAMVTTLDSGKSSAHNYRRALLALSGLPDHCALDVGELAGRIGVEKLQLICWVRAELEFARLVALKIATT